MMSPEVGDLLIGWSRNVLDTPPKFTIFGDQKVKADPCLMVRVIVWSGGQGH